MPKKIKTKRNFPIAHKYFCAENFVRVLNQVRRTQWKPKRKKMLNSHYWNRNPSARLVRFEHFFYFFLFRCFYNSPQFDCRWLPHIHTKPLSLCFARRVCMMMSIDVLVSLFCMHVIRTSICICLYVCGFCVRVCVRTAIILIAQNYIVQSLAVTKRSSTSHCGKPCEWNDDGDGRQRHQRLFLTIL